jgi:hypothetical protein
MASARNKERLRPTTLANFSRTMALAKGDRQNLALIQERAKDFDLRKEGHLSSTHILTRFPTSVENLEQARGSNPAATQKLLRLG